MFYVEVEKQRCLLTEEICKQRVDLLFCRYDIAFSFVQFRECYIKTELITPQPLLCCI